MVPGCGLNMYSSVYNILKQKKGDTSRGNMLNPFPAVIVHPRSVSQQGDGPKQILGRHLEATDTSCIMLHGFGLESLSNTHIYIYIYIYTYTVQFMRTVL